LGEAIPSACIQGRAITQLRGAAALSFVSARTIVLIEREFAYAGTPSSLTCGPNRTQRRSVRAHAEWSSWPTSPTLHEVLAW